MDWQRFYAQAENTILPNLLQFAPWQLQLAEHIKRLRPKSSLESGSGYGQTSYLLADSVEQVVAVDFESYPLQVARQMFANDRRPGLFIQGDLFRLPVGAASFDVLFNAGVFEHFTFTDRCRALTEMARATRGEGTIIIAFPNHFSYPYRYSYSYRLKMGSWPYPQEYPLFDLEQELLATGLEWRQQRKTIDRETAFHFLRRHQRWMLRLAGVFRPFEGYLTIITLDKQGAR